MNCQTSQLRRTTHCWRLLVQESKDILLTGQAYKMEILEKIVNGLKFTLRLIWWTLRVYLFGHLDQWYEWSNWSQHWSIYLFRTFQSLRSWPIGSRVRTGFLQLLGSLESLVFYLFLVSISFAYTSRNPVRMGLHVNTSDKNPKPIYVIKRTNGLCKSLLQLVTQWLGQLDHQSSFACVSISCITWINASVINFSKQIAPNKCQAYRMKVLSFRLSFSYR